MSFKRSRAQLALALLTAATAFGPATVRAQEVPPAAPAPSAPQALSGPLSSEMRRQVFEIVWDKVNNFYYDPKFGGLDWDAVKTKYAPQVDAARSDSEFYSLLNQMLKELKQSHFGIIPPAAYGEAQIENQVAPPPSSTVPPAEGTPPPQVEMPTEKTQPVAPEPEEKPMEADDTDAKAGRPGTAGFTVQLVQGQPIITRVLSGSGAEAAGLKPGFVLESLGAVPVQRILDVLKKRAANDHEYATRVRLGMESILSGPSGRRFPVGYRDADDKLQTTRVELGPMPGTLVQFGQLPPLFVETEKRRLNGNIGYVRFNVFLKPTFDPTVAALTEFRKTGVRGIIIDVRGNPGGLGKLTTGIARQLLNRSVNLGTQTMRDGNVNFLVNPLTTAFQGPVAILTDEGSASTSEILAAGLKEIGRAVTVGATTAGEALPSYIEILPGGARFQYALADLKTPSGNLIEGKGVTPTIPVPLTRAALLTGRDPVLDAAVAYITKAAARPQPKAAPIATAKVKAASKL